MNPTGRSVGGSPIYEQEGHYYVPIVATVGWNVDFVGREVDFDGNPLEGIIHVFNPEWLAHEKERQEEERIRLENAKSFPVEGMSGEFHKGGLLEVWRADSDEPSPYETIEIAIEACHFCNGETACVHFTDDYTEFNVCQQCLNKIFDAFDKKVTG